MNITHVEENTLDVYIFNSYELFNGRIHPAGYDISINKYAVRKAAREKFEHKILLQGKGIDYLFPILEMRDRDALKVIWALLNKENTITLVSASDALQHFTNEKFKKFKDRIEIIIPLWFFNDESYTTYDPSMPVLGYRMALFETLKKAGYKVEPFFNPLPQFKHETQDTIEYFYQKFPDLQYSEARQAELMYILDEGQIEFWEEMEKHNKDNPFKRDMF